MSSARVFPLFELQESAVNAVRGCVGSLTATVHGKETWVGDGYIGYLMKDARLIRGRWYRQGDYWTFEPEIANDRDVVLSRRQWDVLDGYWGERAELVLDHSRKWRRERFEATNAVEFRNAHGIWIGPVAQAIDGEGEIVEGGWEHEHCAICW